MIQVEIRDFRESKINWKSYARVEGSPCYIEVPVVQFAQVVIKSAILFVENRGYNAIA